MTLDTMLMRILEAIPGVDLADFVHEANAGQRRICDANRGRWSWLLASATFTTADKAAEYALPADLRALYAVVDETHKKPLTERHMDHFIHHRFKHGWEHYRFSVVGSSLKLLDIPEDGVELTVWYYKRLPDMESISDTPGLPEYLHELLAQCLLLVYMDRHLGERMESQARIARQREKYERMLADALAEDRNRSKPFLRMERVLF